MRWAKSLGLAYPERGVMFAFEPGKETGKASMKVRSSYSSRSRPSAFVLRAETTLDSRRDLCRRDLEQACRCEPDNAQAHWLHARVLVATRANRDGGDRSRARPCGSIRKIRNIT